MPDPLPYRKNQLKFLPQWLFWVICPSRWLLAPLKNIKELLCLMMNWCILLVIFSAGQDLDHVHLILMMIIADHHATDLVQDQGWYNCFPYCHKDRNTIDFKKKWLVYCFMYAWFECLKKNMFLVLFVYKTISNNFLSGSS